MGYYRMPVHEHPLKERVRAKANHYVTGRDGGRDIDLRQRAKEGMRLYGRLVGVRDGRVALAPDLRQNLDQADTVAESIKTTVDKFIAHHRIDAPMEARYIPVWEPSDEPRELDLAAADITTVIWATGFRTDYGWIELPIFDGRGYPVHKRGVSAAEGLYFLGLPWLYTWGSGRFSGVAADAAFLAEQIGGRLRLAIPSDAAAPLNELALGS
jgi:putative flavoprotein involved in K+ transport